MGEMTPAGPDLQVSMPDTACGLEFMPHVSEPLLYPEHQASVLLHGPAIASCGRTQCKPLGPFSVVRGVYNFL